MTQLEAASVFVRGRFITLAIGIMPLAACAAASAPPTSHHARAPISVPPDEMELRWQSEQTVSATSPHDDTGKAEATPVMTLEEEEQRRGAHRHLDHVPTVSDVPPLDEVPTLP